MHDQHEHEHGLQHSDGRISHHHDTAATFAPSRSYLSWAAKSAR